jgi:hypothetical protein
MSTAPKAGSQRRGRNCINMELGRNRCCIREILWREKMLGANFAGAAFVAKL